MATKRFMIAPLESGLETDVKPWLIADSAFAKLQNAYLYYGILRKRFGGVYMNTAVDPLYAQLYSRFGMNIGTTDGAGDFAGIIPGAGDFGGPGQIFGIGTQILGHEIFTVLSFLPSLMLSTVAGVGTFDSTTGAVDITGSIANAPVYWYPALPVMGLPTYTQKAVNDEQLLGFDTTFAYEFTDKGTGNGRRWELLGPLPPAAGSIIFEGGSDSDFFWTENYRGFLAQDWVLFITNNTESVTGDGIVFWDGTNFTQFNPKYSDTVGDDIVGCKVIASYKERLLLFNTIETQAGGAPIRFPNRLRYSQVGNPLEVNAWNTNTKPGGGYIDLPTTQAIISVEPFKDRLIIFCEESTWELVFTNNQGYPYQFQRINNELGVESAFSTVLFDKAVLGIGNVGIHACNGTNVERIDEKIRQIVFSINNDNFGIERVYGIRDYTNELVYWTYPDQAGNPTFPTKVLVYNYRKGSWSIYDDSITAFGNFQVPLNLQWQQITIQWQQANFAWNNSAQQARFRSIIAGNQQGFTFVVSTNVSRNAAVLSITDIDFTLPNTPALRIIDHNLQPGDFIYIENVFGNNIANFNDTIFQVVSLGDSAGGDLKNNIRLSRTDTAGQAYYGGGVVTRVSRIDILTKQYNFFQQDGRNAYVSKVDFNVDRTAHGEISIDYYASTSDFSLVTSGSVTGTLLGTAVLETTPYAIYPLEAQQAQLWHPLYTQAEGEYIQLRLYLNDQQMFNKNIAFSDFELNAMIIYAEPTSTRLQ